MTFTDVLLASFLGQLLLVAAVAFAYLVVAVLRFLGEWRQDVMELRRSKLVARLQGRLDSLG